ncbi:MAG: hypothetical protein PHU96_06400 [Candidatus Omnitrophica bacterium]|nr:hypothetical protein [Candidatus Omnitrophota bacterium]
MKKYYFYTTLLAVMLIGLSVSSISTFAEESASNVAESVLTKSELFYSKLKDYSCDLKLCNKDNQIILKGILRFKSPNLFRLDASNLYEEKQIAKILFVIDGVNMYSVRTSKLTGKIAEIHNAGGIAGKTAVIKKGQPYISVQLFTPELIKVTKATQNLSDEDLSILDLGFYLYHSMPIYNPNPVFPFQSFRKVYLLDNAGTIEDKLNQSMIIWGIIKDEFKDNSKYNEARLPMKVKLVIDAKGFISFIETYDKGTNPFSSIYYGTPVFNKGLGDTLFRYHIPLNAEVMDMAQLELEAHQSR